MLDSWRAELLVLRRSRVAWVLVALAPLSVLVSTYVFGFLDYDLLTPAQYLQFGTPSQELAGLLPSQFVIETVTTLGQTAPFILLGAVIAGSAWGRGTVKTALVQGPTRMQTFVGQVLALMTASAVSVLACFAVAWLASVGVLLDVGHAAAFAATPAPSLGIVGEAIGAALLVGFAYTALGFALGTLCRSTAGGVAAALAWYAFIEQFLYGLSTDTGPFFTHLYDAFPGASTVTLISMFGSPGGGADSATYQPVAPWASVAILAAYMFVWLAFALVLTLRRDLTAGAAGRLLRRRRARRWPNRDRSPITSDDAVPGVIASLRAELAVMRGWPAMWAFVLIYPVETLLWSYGSQYLLYLNAGHGAITLASSAQVLPTLLPGQFVPTVLNGLWEAGALPGTAAAFLIGALAAGSSWSGGTIRTAVLQAPSRAQTAIGHALAVGVAILLSVLVTFVLAGLVSVALALGLTGGISPPAGPFPPVGHIAAAVGLAAVVCLAWGAAGWTVATVLRSTSAAFAVILLFSTIVETQLDQMSTELSGALRTLYQLLPDASSTTLSFVFGQVDYGGPVIGFAGLAPALAIGMLIAYALAGFALPVILTVRRNLS